VLRRLPSEAVLAATNALGLDNGPRLVYAAPPAEHHQLLLVTTRTFRPQEDASDATEEVQTPSITLPSYGAKAQFECKAKRIALPLHVAFRVSKFLRVAGICRCEPERITPLQRRNWVVEANIMMMHCKTVLLKWRERELTNLLNSRHWALM
jgi:hypothetical protein